jgi:hypothetical protein
MIKKIASGGTAHRLPPDMHKTLTSNKTALAAWENLTPLARNEWICWVTFVKKEETRKDHINRTVRELNEGKRRPCCWLGCTHRKDKQISVSVQGILDKRSKKR